MQLVGY